jgi:tetratricopeptide (TPR) repeat protein
MNASRLRHLLPLALLGLGALALALWLTIGADPSPKAPLLSRELPSEPLPAPANISEEERAPLDQVSTPVKLLVDLHGPHLDRLLEVVARLPHRPLPGDAPDAPLAVSALAQQLAAPKPAAPLPATASFERAMLLGAVGRALDLAPTYGVVGGTRFAATELLARTYAVRFGESPWHVLPALPPLAIVNRPLNDAAVRELSPREQLASSLAFRAMGHAARRARPDAMRLVAQAVALTPDDPAFIFLQGRLEYASGQAELARRTFDRATRLARDPMTDYLLGRLARLDGRPADALRLFGEATLDPAFAEPHVEIAELTLERLDLTPRAEHAQLIAEARAATASARAIAPRVRGLRLAEAHLEALGASPETPLDPARHKAALTLIEEETRLHPTSEEAWLLLAQVHAAASEDAAAVAALERAHASGHETGETANALAQLLAATGRFVDARKAFERALALAPDIAELRPQLAQLLREQGDLPAAISLLEAQLARFPEDHVSALLLAQLAIERADTSTAAALVARVLKASPDHREARLLQYLLELLSERARSTTTSPAPAQPASPARARALEAAGGPRELAEVLLEQGFTAEAMPLLSQALTDTPDDLLAPVMLVALLTAEGRLKDAVDLRQKTVAPLAPADRAELEPLFDTAIAEALKARNDSSRQPEGAP